MVENLWAAAERMRLIVSALTSKRAAIGLFCSVIVSIAIGTLIETVYGRPYALWFIYHSTWFACLLGLVACHALGMLVVRLSWRQDRLQMLTYAGLVLLLFGSALTWRRGIQGQISLLKGNSTDQLAIDGLDQITVSWAERPEERPYVFTFESGPVDWRRGKQLDLGQVDELRARVLNYYHVAQPIERMVADSSGHGGPLVQFEVSTLPAAGPARDSLTVGKAVTGTLADQDFGAELLVGAVAIRLQRANSDAMLADFLQSSPDQLGEKGVLTAYYEDVVEHVAVDDHIGKSVAVGKRGAKVELVQYLANAKLDAAGQFQSIGSDPKNPLVELKVSVPGDKRPFRQVAFAKSPLLNFDGVYGRDCPIKFTYQHPKLKTGRAVELMQGHDGRLYGRVVSDGKVQSLGEVTAAKKIGVGNGSTFVITEYLPHSRREVSFQKAERVAQDHSTGDMPAAQLEIEVAGATRTLWLQRTKSGYDVGTVETPNGPLRVQFTTGRSPLGFKLELVDIQRTTNPGDGGEAAAASIVCVGDKHEESVDNQLITINQPLSYKGYQVFQTGIRDVGHGKQASILTVTYDPGRSLKYLGSGLLCLGVAFMCLGRDGKIILIPEGGKVPELWRQDAA